MTHSRQYAGSEGVGSRTYGQVLRLDELLTMQERIAEAPDTLFFITAHQVYELWFMIVLDELEKTRDAMERDELEDAADHMRRVVAVEHVLVAQIATLETLRPSGFAAIRERLAASSGLQSAQFREIEFLSGLKDRKYLEIVDCTETERARLLRRLSEPSIAEEFDALVERHGSPDLVKLTQSGAHSPLLTLIELLLDHDEGMAHWRARHALMVERLIGHKRGTGGSDGVAYLRSTETKRFFPNLWDIRSRM